MNFTLHDAPISWKKLQRHVIARLEHWFEKLRLSYKLKKLEVQILGFFSVAVQFKLQIMFNFLY